MIVDLPGGRRVMVATDRQSAFDQVLAAVPFKGQVLTQTARFWFDATAEAVSTPPALIVAYVELSLHVGVTGVVDPLSHVAVAVYVPVPFSFTDDGPLIAMPESAAAGAVAPSTSATASP